MNIVDKLSKPLVSICAICVSFLFISQVVFAQGTEETAKREIVFLLDASNSMNTTDPEGLVTDSLEMMICSLPSNDQVGFIAYDGGLQIVETLSSEKKKLKEAVHKSRYNGYTNTGAGIEKALQLFSKDKRPTKSIVLISDGEIMMDSDQATKESADKFYRAKREAELRGIRIYMIVISDQPNPAEQLARGDGGYTNLYEIASTDALVGTAKKVLFDHLDIQRSSVSSGEMQSGDLNVKIPLAHLSSVAKAKTLITSNHSLENISASYNAQNGEIHIGKRFALVDVTRPQLSEMEVRLGSSADSSITADLIVEIKAAIKSEVTYSGASPNEKAKNAEISLIPVDAENEDKTLLDDPYFEGKTVRVTADGEEILAKIRKGKIQFSLPAENAREVKVKINFADLDVNVYSTEYVVVSINPPNDYSKVLLTIFLIALIVFLLWLLKNKRQSPKALPSKSISRYDYAGKLQIYISQAPDDSDIAPQVYNLSRRFSKEEISLGEILTQCGIKLAFPGAGQIRFSPGAGKALIVTNKSDCTILKNRDLLIKDHSCLLYFDERLHITFEDERGEMILYYKNIKPGDK